MVITNVNQVVYQGDGVTTAFPFTFTITDASEVYLQLVHEDDTVTTITQDFYVDVTNNTVHYPGYAPGAEPPEADRPPKVQTGQKLTIWRDVPMTQEKDLGDKWPFHGIEEGLDKLTMICQQIYSYTNRKLDAALASMFQLAGVVTDSEKLQHITDQYNAIDFNAAAAAASAEDAADSATDASDSADAAAASALAAGASETNAQTILTAIQNSYGYPFVAATAADMTDTTKIYVYVGSEAGYTYGNWYYYNGANWTSGGVYNSMAFVTDKTLLVADMAADAQITGNRNADVKKLLNATNNLTEKIYLTGITWELGSFSSSGNVTTNDKRIRTNSKIKFIEPVKLKVIDGYRYAVNFYASSTSTYHDTTRVDGGSSGWKGVNDDYTIEAGTWLTITIAKTAESGDEYTADPTTWSKYVYIDADNHVIINKIDALNILTEYNSQTELKGLINIAGAITTAGLDASSTSYHRSDYIPMLKGTAIIYTDLRATNLAGIGAYDSNKVFDSTSYMSASSKKSGEWVMPFDGYVRLCCRDTELSTTASFKAWNRYNYALYSLEGKVENIDGVPLSEEWKEYLATKEPEIKSALVNIGDAGESFTFVTDCHIPRNNMLTPTIIRTLEKVCPVNYHINGGDFIDINTDSAQSALNVLWQWKDEMHGLTEYCARGNHDSNNYNGENPTNAVTVGQFFAIMDRQIENIVNTNGKTYYCIDNDSQKIRLIVLDSSLADKTEMYAWFSTKLTELDSTWTILVIQHYLWGSTTATIHTNGQATIDAINAVYSSINAKFIGILAGHTHVDYNATESVNGYHLIARLKNFGTGLGTTSLAIDYVTIDKTAETINFLRVGDGSNLSLSY